MFSGPVATRLALKQQLRLPASCVSLAVASEVLGWGRRDLSVGGLFLLPAPPSPAHALSCPLRCRLRCHSCISWLPRLTFCASSSLSLLLALKPLALPAVLASPVPSPLTPGPACVGTGRGGRGEWVRGLGASARVPLSARLRPPRFPWAAVLLLLPPGPVKGEAWEGGSSCRRPAFCVGRTRPEVGWGLSAAGGVALGSFTPAV